MLRHERAKLHHISVSGPIRVPGKTLWSWFALQPIANVVGWQGQNKYSSNAHGGRSTHVFRNLRETLLRYCTSLTTEIRLSRGDLCFVLIRPFHAYRLMEFRC